MRIKNSPTSPREARDGGFITAMEEFHAQFLTPLALERVLAYMCRTSTQDPITESIKIMLTCPVQFHVSRFGLGVFKGCGVFPFTYMTKEQRQWLHELVKAIGGEGYHSALMSTEPLVYTVENDRIFFKGGEPLDAKIVFEVLLRSMAKTDEKKERLKILTNLLLQRIGCRVVIGRDTLAHVHELSERIFV